MNLRILAALAKAGMLTETPHSNFFVARGP